MPKDGLVYSYGLVGIHIPSWNSSMSDMLCHMLAQKLKTSKYMRYIRHANSYSGFKISNMHHETCWGRVQTLKVEVRHLLDFRNILSTFALWHTTSTGYFGILRLPNLYILSNQREPK